MRSKILQLLFAGAGLAFFLSTAIGVVAQSTPSRSLLALSKRNHTLAIVDPKTVQVIARVPVGPDPHEVVASSDGKTAYVSIYGGGRYHALSVVDQKFLLRRLDRHRRNSVVRNGLSQRA